MAAPLLLTYNLDPIADATLRAVCRAQDIRVRAVSPSEYALPVGALAGIPVSPPGEPPACDSFAEPMLVMCHMLSPQLDAFLLGMREAGVRIALKAILTPNNVTWNSRALRDELAREHAAMQKTDRGH